MNEYQQQYYNALVNAPPIYIGAPMIEYANPASHIPGAKQFASSPITFIPDMQPGEIFLQITHSEILPNILPGRYYVSNFGRIFDAYKRKFLPGTDNGNGYINVKLTYIKDRFTLAYKTIYIHQIVNYYFNYLNVCVRDNLTCNHKDSDKSNNRSENLEWITQSENNYHRVINEQKLYIESLKEDKIISKSISHSNISVEAGRKICELLSQGYSSGTISKMLDIKQHTIDDIKYRKILTWLSKDYDFPMNSAVYNIHLSNNDLSRICNFLKLQYDFDKISELTGIDKRIIASVKYNDNFAGVRNKYGI